ncbi:MAG: hypothetical protein AB1489_24980 [Acidobacteriota bacterium]
MRKLSALLSAVCFMGLLTLAASPAVFAQGDQKLDPATERKVYDTLNACIAEKDNIKKLAMAQEALKLYPKSQYVPYLKDQVSQARGSLLQQAMQEGKTEDAFKLAADVLNEEPENLNYLLTLADFSARLAKGPKADYSFADKGTEYAKKAVELINNGKRPVGLDEAQWNTRKGAVLASMHQAVGLFLLKAKKDEDALNALSESAKQDCSDPVTHYLIAQIHNNKYEALSAEYNQLPDDKKSSDDGKAILDKINPVIDQMLEAYGKMMAVSDGKANYDALRNRVKPSMEELYKFRHEGKSDGLPAFIDGFKSSCTK